MDDRGAVCTSFGRAATGLHGLDAPNALLARLEKGAQAFVIAQHQWGVAVKTTRSISRRSFFGRVTGGLAAAGTFGAAAGRAAALQQTDQDRFIADQPGQGQGVRSGTTDSDPVDAPGNGRGNARAAGTAKPPERAPQQPFLDDNVRAAPTGTTDQDPSDPARYGRGATPQTAPANPYSDQEQQRQAGTGVTDSDPTDRVGFGRSPRQTGCSDSDAGINRDPSGSGRNC